MKQTIQVSGMHCQHCALRVADAIRQIDGVKKVKVDLKNNTAQLISNKVIAKDDLERALLLAGYHLIEESAKL